ncbi:MAG: hypothetical protein GY754_01890 [bacterium]|nr:hypothetical protein [bacterium]
MPQSKKNNLPAASPETRSLVEIEVDLAERESLEILLKEIILNLPLDRSSAEEIYRSNIPGEQFKLSLDGFEMRALRSFFQKIRHFGSAQ